MQAVADGADGAVPALPVSDTVKRVHDGRVVETVSRDGLVGVQTPQAFRADALRAAHRVGAVDTDDAALVEADGGVVVVVEGERRNLKLTLADDLELAEAPARRCARVRSSGMKNRVGLGFDVHPFGDEPPLVLGGVRIAEAPRLAGHSDGDAVAHAVADALLGPAGLPDLGTLFPATTSSLRDADSIALLADVVAAGRARLAGGSTTSTSSIAAETAAPRAAHVGDGREPDRGARAGAGADGPRHRRVGPPEAGRRARRDRPVGRHRGVGRRLAVPTAESIVSDSPKWAVYAASSR